MPNTRHQRNHRLREEDAHNNNQHAPVAVQTRDVAAAAGHAQHVRRNDNAEARLQRCCTPGSCRFPDEVIDPEDPYDAVKVACNNEACGEGDWMHKDCFEDFEQSVLAYLRSCGRARSWSEKQRLQNLWTKKGYDLAFKACDCKCGRGHLRKDLDYIPPPFNENSKKHKRHKKKNDKPMPVVSTTHKNNSQSSQAYMTGSGSSHTATAAPPPPANRTQQNPVHNGRASTATGQKSKKTKSSGQRNDNSHHQLQGVLDNHNIASSPATTTTTNPHSPTGNNNHIILGALPGSGNPQLRLRTNSVSSTGSAGSHSSTGSSSVASSAGSPSPISSSPMSENMFFKSRKSSDASTDSGPSMVSGFRQRLDMSAFAFLPRNKQNSYHIRMEDASSLALAFSTTCSMAAPKVRSALAELAAEAGSCDVETRNFVLGNLMNKKVYSTRCVLCKTSLPVFDRLPLIDGTFFLSPQSYDEAAIQVSRF